MPQKSGRCHINVLALWHEKYLLVDSLGIYRNLKIDVLTATLIGTDMGVKRVIEQKLTLRVK